MGTRNWFSAAIAVILVFGGIGYWYWKTQMQHPEEAPVEASAPPPALPAAPPKPDHYPVDTTQTAQTPLPALGDSDGAVRGFLQELFGKEFVATDLLPQRYIQNIVATVDTLDNNRLAPIRLRVVRPLPGTFSSEAKDGGVYESHLNLDRYRPFFAVVKAVDAGQAAALYLRLYPLFQQAYEELGYPGKYFNDRLVQVIDHLLQAPDLDTAPALTRPGMFYQYADADLESRSSGQKLLMRVGPVNEALIKTKLRAFRAAIVGKVGKP